MKYKRMTEKAIGCFGYDLKDFEHKPKEFNDYDAFYAYKTAVGRLGELEDKIESGEIDYAADSKTEQTITDLLIEFDEMGFIPTTVCPNLEQYATEWRERVRKEFARLTDENERLREEVDSLSHENDELEYKTEKFEAENAELKATISKMETVEKELRARLEKAVEPKLSNGDKAYAIMDTLFFTDVFPVEIKSVDIVYEVFDGEQITTQHCTRIFTDRAAAEARLAELKGGTDE